MRMIKAFTSFLRDPFIMYPSPGTVTQSTMKNILLIEDEKAIAENVIYALDTEGYKTQWLTLGVEGVTRVQQGGIDLVILDVGLPDMNGFEVCKSLRRFSEVPVIFLTARHEEIDRIVGLEIGADDYVCKPFSPRELATRVKVILRRSGNQSQQTSEVDFEMEETAARIKFRKQTLTLTRYEFFILMTLLRQPDRIFSREQLMQQAWDDPTMSFDRAVDTHIKTLRSKLRAIDDTVSPIVTHRGMGYSISGTVREH